MRKDAVGTQTVRIYIPDAADGKIYYVEREVSYRTNYNTGKLLEAACKKAVNEASGKVLSDDTVVNSLALDEENRVRVDFNASFTADMDTAVEYEPVILQCIADTLGFYYNSENVPSDGRRKNHTTRSGSRWKRGSRFRWKLEGINQKGGAS